MKRTYVRPTAVVENFNTDAFCANETCGKDHVIYNFECNAGLKKHSYAVKDASGNIATISGKKMDGYWNYFHPCSETHSAESNSGFLTGYHIDDSDTKQDENIEVIIWTNNNTNVHCTTNLDMEKWTTVKS